MINAKPVREPASSTTALFISELTKNRPSDVIQHILEQQSIGNGYRVAWGVTEHEKARGCSWQKYYDQLYEKIDKRIHKCLGQISIKDCSGTHYEVCSNKHASTHIYLFIAPVEFDPGSPEHIFDHFKGSYNTLLEKLLTLLLKGEMIDSLLPKYSKTYTYYQSMILIDSEIDTNENYEFPRMHALDVRLSYKEPNEINLYLVRKVLEVEPVTSNESDVLSVITPGKVTRFRFRRWLNAHYDKRPYRVFPPQVNARTPVLQNPSIKRKLNNIEKSVFYWQLRCYESLKSAINGCGLTPEPFIFKAQFTIDHFVTLREKIIPKKVVLIDALGETGSNSVGDIREEIQNYWPNTVLAKPEDYPDINSFHDDCCYLVLSQCQDNSANSILANVIRINSTGEQVVETECLSDTFDLIQLKQSKKLESCDYYSKIKLGLVALSEKSEQSCPIIQGINIPSDERACIYFRERLNHLLNKITNEFAVKDAVYQAGRLEGAMLCKLKERNASQENNPLIKTEVVSIYVRRKKKKKKDGLEAIQKVALSWLKASGNTISIERRAVVSSSLRLCDLIGDAAEVVWELPDRANALLDVHSERLLTCYTDNSVPMLTARFDANALEIYRIQGYLSRSATQENNLFPYHNNNPGRGPDAPGQIEHIYIHDRLDELLIFVSSSQSLRNQPKQRRVYRLQVIDFFGKTVTVMDQPVTEVCLNFFDRNILNENDTAQSCFLWKFSRVLIDN